MWPHIYVYRSGITYVQSICRNGENDHDWERGTHFVEDTDYCLDAPDQIVTGSVKRSGYGDDTAKLDYVNRSLW